MAAPAYQVETLEDPARARILQGGEVLLELYGAQAGTAGRVVQLLLARPRDPLKVTIDGDRAVLWLGGQRLAEVGPEQATRWNSTPFSLARSFQAALEAARQGRTRQPRLEPARLTVPLGEARSARWLDVGGTPKVEVSDPAVAAATVEGGRLKVTGVGPGEARVTLTWPARSLDLPVQVRLPAGRIPDRLDVAVTGEGLGRPELEEALRRVLLARGSLAPRARVGLAFLKPPAVGAEGPVKVSLSGSGLLPAEHTVPVRFTRVAAEVYPARSLVMSNRPEKVTDLGVLLRQAVPEGPARVLFHHRNLEGQPERYLEVLLSNRSGSPARVLLILVGVGPSQDEIFAGHLATTRFLDRLARRRGVVLALRPGETVPVERLLMKPGQTVSGMGWVQPLEGSGLEMVFRVEDPWGATSGDDLADPGPGPFPTGRGAFPPEVQGTWVHDLGSAFTYVPVGEAPVLRDPGTGEPNPGNFGVVHRLRLIMRNPTAETRDAWLDFVARGGPARGLFFVDGTFVETGLGSHGSPQRLGRWTLAPGEEKEVVVETLPQSGSNYPVNLVIQSEYLSRPAGPPPEERPPLEPRYLP